MASAVGTPPQRSEQAVDAADVHTPSGQPVDNANEESEEAIPEQYDAVSKPIIRNPFQLLKDKNYFRKFCLRSFKNCDYDGSGLIETKELHIGLLMLYDQINDLLPIHIDVPTHDTIVELVEKHDVDKSGMISFDEYCEICRDLFLTKRNWRNSLMLRIIVNVSLKMLAFPFIAIRIKRRGSNMGIPGFKWLDESIFITAVEVLATTLRPI